MTEAETERAAIVAWLWGSWGFELAHKLRGEGVSMLHLPRLLAAAIERIALSKLTTFDGETM